MARIPEMTRDNLPEDQRAAYDEVMAAGKPQGPSSIAIHSPELAKRRMPLRNYLRFETTIPDRILELAILVTARCLDCPYVWNAHAPLARKAGVSNDVVRALCWNEPVQKAPDDELALIAFCQELLRTHTVRGKTFSNALEQFSTQHLVEITALLGTYAQNVFFLNAFGVELPETTEPIMPVGLQLEEEY